ncbi:MAG: radical SAM protein [Desulfobulbaceae bacterium]|nr:MAG: radical SAM protein [Desulfobulbaceae bacterium]
MSQIHRTVDFSIGERNIFLHILTACNLSCSHCYINPEQHGRGQLTREELARWIPMLRGECAKANIVFLGGEPTLHRELPFAVETAKTCGYNVTVDSNGYLFNDFLEKSSPELLDFLSFSLDGPTPQINDMIRGVGVYQTCTENIAQAVKRKFSVSLIYTVSSKNIEYLHLMPPLLERLGVKRFFIQVIGLRGKSAESQEDKVQPSLQVQPERWLSVVPEVAEYAASLGISTVYPKVYLGQNENFECAGNVAENYFVFPNGRVYQCPLCEDYPIHTYQIENHQLIKRAGINEDRLFQLGIEEGCVMNRLLQPDTIVYNSDGRPVHKISCCLLKQQAG